jgi:hypothetical protein
MIYTSTYKIYQGSSVSIVTRLQVMLSRDRVSIAGRDECPPPPLFAINTQIVPGACLVSCLAGNLGLILRGQSGRPVNPTSHLYLTTSLLMCGALPPLSLTY